MLVFDGFSRHAGRHKMLYLFDFIMYLAWARSHQNACYQQGWLAMII